MTETATVTERDARSKELLLELLSRARTFLEAAESEIPQIASKLRAKDLASAMPDLGRLLDGLGSVAQLLVELERAGAAELADAVDLGSMSAALRRLVERQQQQDWDGAAGVLDAGIAVLLPDWRSALAVGERAVARA